jgi:ABC-2 type transport system permease protein
MLAQVRKELRQLTRDRLAVALALLLPLIQLTLMGQSLAFIVRDLPLVVQDFDDSPASRELAETFRASQTFRVVPWPTDRKPDDAFIDNSARGALVIPRDFGRDLARGVDAPVQLLVDGSDANTARLLAGYAGGVTRSFNASHQHGSGRQPVVQAAIRFWYNPSLSSKRFYGPGIFVMALSMFPPLLATLAMAREGERKTILQVYVSNISAFEFLLGKIIAFMIVAFAECLLLLTFLFVFFGVRLAGDPTPFLVATAYGADGGLNFTGFRFNAPNRLDNRAYVAKMDFVLDKAAKRTLSPEARARISAAVKRRWKAHRKAKKVA